MADVCRTCVGRVTTWRTCVRRVKNVQQTTVEKFEKVYKNSSEMKKVRQSQEETRKVFTNKVQDVADVCRTCNNL